MPGKIHSQLLSLFRHDPLDQLVHDVAAGSVTHVLYPHEVFALIFRKFPDAFRVHLGGMPATLLKFWSSFLATPYGRLHPRLNGKTPEELSYTIPLVLHGDAVPYAHRSSAVFVQWGSLLGTTRPPQFIDLAHDSCLVSFFPGWLPWFLAKLGPETRPGRRGSL
jgi:hypothetical protein